MRELDRLNPGALPAREALLKLNDLSENYGLRLGENQIARLEAARWRALKDEGRMEFDGGALPKLVYAFCDSPYLLQEDYAETLERLQAAFYHFKGEALERLGDDELIKIMRENFDEPCRGDLDFLEGTVLEEIARRLRA